MRGYLDTSKTLYRFIVFVSETLAARRGLLPLIGIGMTIVGFTLLIVDVFAAHWVIELAGVLFQGLGIIIALIGLLLIEPLGPAQPYHRE
jgi:hypothetical protein